MENALQRNQWQFVEYFLRQGFKVEQFLTEEMLIALYFRVSCVCFYYYIIDFCGSDFYNETC